MGAKMRRKKQELHGNIFWVTMSDLFIGMFMIFATLFFAFCANTGQGASAEATMATREVVKVIAERLQEQSISAIKQSENGIPVGSSEGQFEGATPQKEVVKESKPKEAKYIDKEQEEKKKEEQKIEGKKYDVEIDPFTGMARISDLELFKLNSAELTPKGREFLAKFIPIYLDAIFSSELKKYVMYIIIQGHTDSHMFKGIHSPQEQYMLNMNLSMNRAYNVANYVFMLSKNKSYYKDLTKMIRVEGASFSKTLKKPDGSEDYNRSRRVELRLVLKEQKLDLLQQLFGGAKSAATGRSSEYEKL